MSNSFGLMTKWKNQRTVISKGTISDKLASAGLKRLPKFRDVV